MKTQSGTQQRAGTIRLGPCTCECPGCDQNTWHCCKPSTGCGWTKRREGVSASTRRRGRRRNNRKTCRTLLRRRRGGDPYEHCR